jgi:hypothetical protein
VVPGNATSSIAAKACPCLKVIAGSGHELHMQVVQWHPHGGVLLSVCRDDHAGGICCGVPFTGTCSLRAQGEPA